MRGLTVLLSLTAAFGSLGANELELPIVLDMTDVPDCIQACLSGLFHTAAEMIHVQNPIKKFNAVCKAYDEAVICVEEQKDTCTQTTLFDVALSGLEELCNEKENELRKYRKCLEKHVEVVLKDCDRSCHIANVLLELSKLGNAERTQKLKDDPTALDKEVSAVCTTFGCMASCAARALNDRCAPVGTIITEALMKPFFTAAMLFEEIGPRAKISIYRQIPSQCYYLIDFESVKGVANGEPPAAALAKNPEEAVLKEVAIKDRKKKQKKAELQKQFLMDAQHPGPF